METLARGTTQSNTFQRKEFTPWAAESFFFEPIPFQRGVAAQNNKLDV